MKALLPLVAVLLALGVAWLTFANRVSSPPDETSRALLTQTSAPSPRSPAAPTDRSESPVSTYSSAAEQSVAGDAGTPSGDERYPDAPGVPGKLPFASGSIQERAWLLRRSLRDLQDTGTQDERVQRAGYEILSTAIGGLLDIQGRGRKLGVGEGIPTIPDDEFGFVSQGKFFSFKRFEFPDYALFRAAADPTPPDFARLRGDTEWMARVDAFARDAINVFEHVTAK